jgi:caa(3)-type oxidase subunit IV
MSAHGKRPNYFAIWVWLVVLMAIGLLAAFVPGGKGVGITLMFAAAVGKAALVVLNYMHLRFESWLVVAIALVPVILVIGMMLALFPDFVFHH